ncbi:MAG: hypothetical protein ABEI52_04950 [Halobacteriaceae archaeon]
MMGNDEPSLDEFTERASDSTEDDSAGKQVEIDHVTSRVFPSGTVCPRCEMVVTRLWRSKEGDHFICIDCRSM